MAKYWTSKYGTKIDISGLTPEQVKQVQSKAQDNGAYGTAAAKLADSFRKGSSSGGSKTTETKKIDYTDPNQVAGKQETESKAAADDSFKLANPTNDVGVGSKQTVTRDPVTGEVTRTTELTGANKDLYNAETGAETAGARIAGQLISGIPSTPYNANNLDPRYGIPVVDQGYIRSYEDSAYQSLTRDLDRDEARALDAAKTDLRNRGIPFGSEDYNRQLAEVQRRFDNMRSDARVQSQQAGLNAATSYYDIGLRSHQQALGNMQSNYALPTNIATNLVGMGRGYTDPTQAYTPVQRQPVDYGGLYAGEKSAETARKQLANNLAVARTRASGGGGGGGGSQDNGLTFV